MLQAEVDLTEIDGASPLIIAAQHGHAACVRSLLSAGAAVDLEREEQRRLTALMYASIGEAPLLPTAASFCPCCQLLLASPY